MTAEVVTGIVTGVVSAGFGGGLFLFIVRNIYARLKALEDLKADKSMCIERHNRVDADQAENRSIYKDIYEKMNEMAKNVAVIAASVERRKGV